jgi:hypothetical protein
MSITFFTLGFFVMGASFDYDPIYGVFGFYKHAKLTEFLFYTLIMNSIFFLGYTYIGVVSEATVPAT